MVGVVFERQRDRHPPRYPCYRSLNSEQTRAGMYKILGEDVSAHLRAKDTPGVFSQGLVVYSGAGDEVLYERLLDIEIVSQVASFCEEKGVSLIAYSGDEIVSEADGLLFSPACTHVCAFTTRQGSKRRDREHTQRVCSKANPTGKIP